MHLFTRTWAALHAAVAALSAEDFTRPSGCRGWLVRDLVCHLIVNAQDVLITLVTPAGTAPTHDAITYWTVTDEPPTGEDPGDAVTVRLAAAYGDPALLRAHLDDVGSAAGRAAELADLGLAVSTQDMVLTVDDFLMVYALEWTLHHLDLIAHVPGAEPARRGAGADPGDAGEDHRDGVPGVVLGHGRPAGGDGSPFADGGRGGGAGRPGRAAAVRARARQGALPHPARITPAPG